MKPRNVIIILAFTSLLGCNHIEKKSNRIVQLNYYEEQYNDSTDSLFDMLRTLTQYI